MNRKVEQGRVTREQLVATATRLFADRGYEDTSIEAVLHESDVSRGALYHHFAGKEALFEAVLDAVGVKIKEDLAAVTGDTDDAVAALRAGCLAWIRLATDPVVQRVLLIDAPSVLGWQRWRERDERDTLGMLKIALRAAAKAGRLRTELVDPFAHMLLAALNEIAFVIARAEDPDSAGREGQAAVEELLERLLGPAQ
ncbi:MAG: TetR family transcriptional regulator [Streptosporangiales bacterium]|nr:TetR family transcriptional regulator [Streptosporangiales bacterium]